VIFFRKCEVLSGAEKDEEKGAARDRRAARSHAQDAKDAKKGEKLANKSQDSNNSPVTKLWTNPFPE